MSATSGHGDQIYATLLLSDTYLPGALVLAHSLRDAATTKPLAAFITLDTVSAEVITQLKAVYDHVIPVPRIRNERPANLHLMNRADLHSAFTKVNLWKQVHFSKIVYLDADVLAYRAPDELFNLTAPFSAAPDIGWPDIFNTGVMVLTPNMGDYYALMAMAERGISFDGADQGLLNMHFQNNFSRLSFTYNVTPSAHYQYVPAYRHFQSSINMVHFIGSVKPWFQGRHANNGDSPFDQMFGRWWAVYDRHYREDSSPDVSGHPQQQQGSASSSNVPEIVQYFTKGEFRPAPPPHPPSTGEHEQGGHRGSANQGFQQGQHHHHHYQHRHHQAQSVESHGDHSDPAASSPFSHSSHFHSGASFGGSTGPQAEAREDQGTARHEQIVPPPPVVEKQPEPAPPPPSSSWDAQWQPPPQDAKPEAVNFPHQTYEMSQDPAPFVPPERYPSPPKNMWYEVPKEKPAPHTPRAIFPWEGNQPQPTRSFPGVITTQEAPSTPTASESKLESSNMSSWPPTESSFVAEKTSTAGRTSEPVTPVTPTITISPSDPWSAFTRSNAWDEMPEIERYVSGLQKHRRTGSQGKSAASSGSKKVAQERGLRLTDFPSEVDRPSLPVTPAPVRRGNNFWGSGGDLHGASSKTVSSAAIGKGADDQELPTAQGVPLQTDWNPEEQLQKLAKQQSEALLRRLSGDEESGLERGTRSIPMRPHPFGSEGAMSLGHGQAAHQQQPASFGKVLSPQPVKGSATSNVVRGLDGNDGESSGTTRTSSYESAASTVIPEPSYHGPGPSWEKDEDIPTQETPMPPTEDKRDAFQ